MPDDLLQECAAARRRGLDFPTIWREILRIHPLVAGPAIQMADRDRCWHEVPLITGQRLVFHDGEGFSLLGRVAIALRDRPSA